MIGFRLPESTHRTTINGRTGSGKTVFAAWLLAESANFDEMPWTIIDYKGDELLSNIPRIKEAEVLDRPHQEPGLYYLHPAPRDIEAMETWLWRVWEQGRHGLLLDEGNMIPERMGIARTGGPFKTLLTQGRALHIPVITLSQRPVDLNKHVFSEADFYACFELNYRKDRERVAEFTPEDPVWSIKQGRFMTRLPKYHARWYDVGQDYTTLLKPCPDMSKILAIFDARLRPKQRWI